MWVEPAGSPLYTFKWMGAMAASLQDEAPRDRFFTVLVEVQAVEAVQAVQRCFEKDVQQCLDASAGRVGP